MNFYHANHLKEECFGMLAKIDEHALDNEKLTYIATVDNKLQSAQSSYDNKSLAG